MLSSDSLDVDLSAGVAISQRPVAPPIRTRIEISPVRLLRWHVICVLLLTLAHLAVSWVHLETGRDHLMGLTQRLQLFTEASIPSFFSALMLVVAAVSAAVLSWVEGGRRTRDGRAWAFITALLLFMAVDEAVMIHEIALNLRQRQQQDGMLYYFWVVPFGGLALVCMAVLLPFWWRLPRHTKWWLAAAAALFLASAVGMELVESALVAEAGEQTAYAQWDVIAAITLEECGEMLAVGMAIYALLQHLALTQGTFGSVRFELPQTRGW